MFNLIVVLNSGLRVHITSTVKLKWTRLPMEIFQLFRWIISPWAYKCYKPTPGAIIRRGYNPVYTVLYTSDYKPGVINQYRAIFGDEFSTDYRPMGFEWIFAFYTLCSTKWVDSQVGRNNGRLLSPLSVLSTERPKMTKNGSFYYGNVWVFRRSWSIR